MNIICIFLGHKPTYVGGVDLAESKLTVVSVLKICKRCGKTLDQESVKMDVSDEWSENFNKPFREKI